MSKDKNKKTVLEIIQLPQGFSFDLDEGWRKVIARQFGGHPARGFAELIQNFLDSYPADVSWEDRLAKIETGGNSISIIDYGEGMDRKRIQLLLTLGGTDKKNNSSKIGRWGLGFFSIFNPSLGTKKVTVTTKCEGYPVEVVFVVTHPEMCPEIHHRILEGELDYSTKVEVEFSRRQSVEDCLGQARESLTYYPCRVLIDGLRFTSIWENHRGDEFKTDHCHGFFERGDRNFTWVNLLCKYEKLIYQPWEYLISGGRGYNDIRGLRSKSSPYLKGHSMTVNCNNLSVTLSRDSFYLDWRFDRLVGDIKKAMMSRLAQILSTSSQKNKNLILSNHYTLGKQLGKWLHSTEKREGKDFTDEEKALYPLLVKEKVYQLSERDGNYSLEDLHSMRTAGRPVYFSKQWGNVNWLGGRFKHDFIVLIPIEFIPSTSLDTFPFIMTDVFGDVVDLEKVPQDAKKIQELIDRGLVEKEDLSPEVDILDPMSIDEEAYQFLEEINELLALPTIHRAVEKNLFFPCGSIRADFFQITRGKIAVSAGLFQNGRPVDGGEVGDEERDIVVGLHLNHSLIEKLIYCDNPHRGAFALTFLAREITRCQKLLTPYSSFYEKIQASLIADIRRALVQSLLVCE